MKRKPLTEAQRRVMTYLTHEQGMYAKSVGTTPGYYVFTASGEAVGLRIESRTLWALSDADLVTRDERTHFYTPTVLAWSLLTEGELL